MNEKRLKVGRVLRAETRGFVVGCEVMEQAVPSFGAFVRAEGHAPGSAIYGLIYDVSVEDDRFVRHFIGTDVPEEVVLDQRENRQVPIEVSVLAIGTTVEKAGPGEGATIRHCLPEQPPVTLDWLYRCTDEEIRAFTGPSASREFHYFRLVLDAHEAPSDELLATSLRNAAAARPESEREAFLIDAGRELVRLLVGDPARLEGLLSRLRT